MTRNPALPACVSGMRFSRLKFIPPHDLCQFVKFCLRATAGENHAVVEMPPTSDHPEIPDARRKWWFRKIITFLAASLLLGVFYSWSSPRAFPKDASFGFGYGMMHGALMPMALPSLILGQDVEIFAPENTGCNYKIGFILGINACGLVFFGPLVWRPRVDPKNQKNQER